MYNVIMDTSIIDNKLDTIYESDSNSEDFNMELINDNDNNINDMNNDNNSNDDNLILGIDLGTTNSCISIWRNNNIEIIPDEHGNKTVPSYVSYTNVNKYIGIEAKKQREINTENVFYEVKRFIGRNYDDDDIQNWKDYLSYEIVKNDRGMISFQSSIRNNKLFTPEEISSNILTKLKTMAKNYLKKDVKDVIITVPAHFSDSQRQATKDACVIAGLNCLRLIHEPTSAALAYGVLDRTISKSVQNANKNNNNTDSDSDDSYYSSNIMVYDLGGGTLDVSIIEVDEGGFTTLGCSGNSHFGGVDFDNRIIAFCIKKFSVKTLGKKIDIIDIPKLSMQKLRKQCENAKKILSSSVKTMIIVSNFYEGKDLTIKLTRSDFENCCKDLFLICLNCIDSLMKELELSQEEIDEVILVGGMTRMPYIRKMLENKFRDIKGKNKINCSINPDEAVSMGAAIQGYILMNKGDPFSESITFLDVIPLSLGIKVLGGVMEPIIERNTIIPTEVSKYFTTCDDYEDSVLIEAYEGERTLTEHNTKIGEFILDNLPKYERGLVEIEVIYDVDSNGILTITAKETENEVQNSIIVNTNKNGLKQSEIDALVQEAEEQEAIDEIDRVKRLSYYEIEDLISNIISNINNKNYKISEKDISVITNEMKNITDWLLMKKYFDRDVEEYEGMIAKIKKKYGVLILHGKLEGNNVDGVSEVVQATKVRGKDEDDDDLKELVSKVEKEEMGIEEGMTDNEINEIKLIKENLNQLCDMIMTMVGSNKMNLTKEHKNELVEFIDDTYLWFYSLEKPKHSDYKMKIDEINSLCEKIVNIYEQDKKDLFKKTNFDDESDKYSDKLEKLCLTLQVLLNDNNLQGSKSNLNILQKLCEKNLIFIYENRSSNVKDAFDKNDKEDLINTDFENDCKNKLEKLNNRCNIIANSSRSKFDKDIFTNVISNTDDINDDNTNNNSDDDNDNSGNPDDNNINNNIGTSDDINGKNIDTGITNDNDNNNNRDDKSSQNNIVDNKINIQRNSKEGMSVLDLLRIKQNESINNMIYNDSDNDSDNDDDILDMI
jgi:L1 cell adhesion molecule like protein